MANKVYEEQNNDDNNSNGNNNNDDADNADHMHCDSLGLCILQLLQKFVTYIFQNGKIISERNAEQMICQVWILRVCPLSPLDVMRQLAGEFYASIHRSSQRDNQEGDQL